MIEIHKTPEEIRNCVKNNINYLRFENIALNIFGWKNLPETIPERILEKFLYFYGCVVFYKDDEYGFLTLPAFPQAILNPYFDFTKCNAWGYNIQKELDISYFSLNRNGVLIRNNNTVTPTFNIIKYYVDIITNVDRTIETQLYTMKKPYIISGNNKTVLSIKNFFKNIFDNNPFCVVDDNLKNKIKESLELMEIKTDYHVNELFLYKSAIIGELCEILGFKSQTFEKKERLLVDEINSNNDFTYMNIVSQFNQRKKSSEEINKIWGLNIEPYIKVKENDLVKSIHEGGINEGEVYNNIE